MTVLTVVTGPPCAGKTTHVREHAKPTDLVLDLDAMAHAMGYPNEQVEWGDDHPAIQAARMARAHVLNALLNHRLQHAHAWVIDTDPRGGMRAQYERAGARFVRVDPGRAVCLERAANRSASTREGIENWYQRHGESQPVRALDIFR